MKNITIVGLLLVMSLSIQAQTTDTQTSGNGSFISAVGGISMPMGNWKKAVYNANDAGAWLPDDADNLAAGFAGNGFTFGYEGAHFVSKYIGFGGMICYSSFRVPTAGLNTLSSGYQASYDVDSVKTTITGAYTMWAFLPGVYFKYPFSDKLSVTGKFLAGFTSSTTPTISVHVWDSGIDDGSFVQKASTATAFGFMGGIGFSYNLCSNFTVNLQGNYFSSNPDFIIDNTNRANTAGRQINEYNQPLSYLNVSLGLAYVFGKK